MKTYSKEDMERILSRAIQKRESGSGAISHEQLLEVARELGLTEQDIESAALEEVTHGELDRAKERWLQRKKRDFFINLSIFLPVNGILAIINAMTTPDHWWFLYPLLGWSFSVVGQAFEAFFSHQDTIERNAKKLLRREEKKRLKE